MRAQGECRSPRKGDCGMARENGRTEEGKERDGKVREREGQSEGREGKRVIRG